MGRCAWPIQGAVCFPWCLPGSGNKGVAQPLPLGIAISEAGYPGSIFHFEVMKVNVTNPRTSAMIERIGNGAGGHRFLKLKGA